MLRILFTSLILLMAGYVFLQSRLNQRSDEKPVFLRTDTIAQAHQTSMAVCVESPYKPSAEQVAALTTDYADLWAHLNHLYSTNDVEAGKEYYTEAWFAQLCRHYAGVQLTNISRHDERHELHLQNWSTDGLVCTALDSNVVLTYRYPDQSTRTTRANLAVSLLFQGDHWRVDALRVLNESTTPNL